MSRKDRRPESRRDRNTAGELSSKATDPHISDDETVEGFTEGAQERGPEPGQYTDLGSPGLQKR